MATGTDTAHSPIQVRMMMIMKISIRYMLISLNAMALIVIYTFALVMNLVLIHKPLPRSLGATRWDWVVYPHAHGGGVHAAPLEIEFCGSHDRNELITSRITFGNNN